MNANNMQEIQKLNTDNDSLATKLWLESFRYCLTRKTYAVEEFCDYYEEYYQQIPEFVKTKINQELKRKIEQNSFDDEDSKQSWIDLNHWIDEQKDS